MSGPDTPAEITAPTSRTLDETQAADERREQPQDEHARGTVIGRYVVLARLGAGAMGVVYAAYDPDLDRKVAVKLLQSRENDDDAGSSGHRRLLREAQAMAQLSHPNVVAVHDVGVHRGRVFVAMEFVQGRTLREWISRRPPWQDVLDVFVAAGRGLQAAHERGLVHRDFKPDNVMIGDDGRVRVMDFGLARAGTDPMSRSSGAIATDVLAASSRRALDDELTQHGSLVGTPAYMAPEQIAHEGGGPLADQFSFCVSFWEGLHGERPFAGDTFAQLAAAVLEGEPRPPPPGSTAPRWLRRVVQRGLSRQPEARWPSMKALVDALTRDRARTQRSTGLVALGVLGVVGVGAIAWEQTAEKRRTADCETEGAAIETVWNDDARAALRRALEGTGVAYATQTAERVTPWLDAHARRWAERRTEVCLAVRVEERQGWDADVLDRAMWCLDERRLELEALVGELSRGRREAVSRAVTAAANLGPLEPCLDRERLLRLPAPPADRRDALQAVRADVSRANTLADTGRFEEGLELARAALQSAEQLEWPPLVAATRHEVGQLLRSLGRFPEAEEALMQAYFEASHAGATDVAALAAEDLAFMIGYELSRQDEGRTWSKHAEVHEAKLPDPAEIGLAAHVSNLAAIHWASGEFDDATAAWERVLEIQERALDPDNLAIARTLNNLAIARAARGQHAEAKELHERSLELTEKALGADHPDLAKGYANLASAHWGAGEYTRARELHEHALAIREKVLDPDHPELASSYNELGIVHRALGAYDEARAFHERALAIREKALGPDHPDVGRSLLNLGNVHSDLGDVKEAGQMYERALAAAEKAFGPEHPDVAGVLLNIANVRMLNGELAEARAACDRALAIFEKSRGPSHQDVAFALHTLGDVHVESEAYADALDAYRRSIAIVENVLGPDHPEAAATFTNIGNVHFTLGEHEAAERAYRRAVAIFEQSIGASHPDLSYAFSGLARVALARGNTDEAVALAERAAALAEPGDARMQEDAQRVLSEARAAAK